MAKKRRWLKPPSPKAAGQGVIAPVVAIVGRPNVGKSSLFNRLIGRNISIVEPTAGVTRDRIAALYEIADGRHIELVDTGGLGGSDDTLKEDVDRQIHIALEYADYIIFLVDGRMGVSTLDKQIARRIGKLNKPVVVAVNKCETLELEENSAEFWEFGLGEPVAISAQHGYNTQDLRDRLAELIPQEPAEVPPMDKENRDMRIAIVGRRNVGKSTYVNALFGEERVIANEMPGTTRDPIDVRVQFEGRSFVLIDTAGLRRRGRVDDSIEYFAHLRAREAVNRSDVALLFLDATQRVSIVDKQLARLIVDDNKSCAIVATKWDLVGNEMTLDQYSEYLTKHIPNLRFAPVVAMSSTESVNVSGPINAAVSLYKQSKTRVSTGQLNRVIRAAYDKKRPRVRRNVLPRIYFATQISTNPVTIIIFVNKPSLFTAGYRRYLAGQLRNELPYSEVPIKFIFRERVNIFEAGLHQRIRRLKAIDDGRYISQQGVEEQPVDSQENIAEVFEVLFGERPSELGASLEDILEVAEQTPEVFTDTNDRVSDDFDDSGDHVFDEKKDGLESGDENAAHPMNSAHQIYHEDE